MQINDKKKICIVVSSLADGGAEKSSALLSQMLSNLGHDIHIVSVLNKIDYEYSGRLFNLGELKDKNDTLWGRLQRLRKFIQYLKQGNFDFVIDNRSRNSLLREMIVSRFIYNPRNTIYCVRSYILDNSFIHPKIIAKWLYSNAFKIIAVSKEIAIEIKDTYGFSNVRIIYNPVEKINLQSSIISPESPYILFYGRLNNQIKNVSLLLKAYKYSQLPLNNIKLKILGNGEDLQMLQNFALELNIKSVEFLPYDPKPEVIIENAKFTVLTSKYEGFPRVLIESLALGTPVISVDCKSGPNEIIYHGENGLLVPNNDPKALSEAMNKLINDEILYLRCKENSKESVERFSMERISQDWNQLLNERQE